jgi:hypothetical protein
MKQLATGLGIIVIGSFLFFGVSFLVTYVMVDLAALFEVPYLKDFTFWNFFGLTVIFSILNIKSKKTKGDEDDADEKLARSIGETLSSVITLLLLWGLCYVVNYFFL